MYSDLSLKKYINELSSDKPIPGGGGTSALVAALGISLVIMVARISLKHLDSDQQQELSKKIELLDRLRAAAEQVIDLDPQVYQGVMKAYIQKKNVEDPKQAQALVDAALRNSFKLQADLSLLISTAKQLLNTVDTFTKGSIRNDLVVANALLEGAFKGAIATANINLEYMKDEDMRDDCEKTLNDLKKKFSAIKFE